MNNKYNIRINKKDGDKTPVFAFALPDKTSLKIATKITENIAKQYPLYCVTLYDGDTRIITLG
jgi:hypothetical protein